MTEKKKVRRKASKKKASKKTSRKVSDNVEAKDLIPADYNPRKMDSDAEKGLKKSMEEFGDISGITWNQRTNNIVTGHHRWANLLDEYGMETITLEHISGDRHKVLSDGEETGFVIRVVDWDDTKEKAANISANSNKIEGQFTADLSNLLSEIKMDMNIDTFGELRLDDLAFEMDYLSGGGGEGKSANDDDWDSDIEAIKKVDENDQQMYANITITCKAENKEELLEVVKGALDGQEFEIR